MSGNLQVEPAEGTKASLLQASSFALGASPSGVPCRGLLPPPPT